MIKDFDTFVNEELNLANWGRKSDELYDKIILKVKSFIRYPVIKYIEKKIEKVSDIKKLKIMAEVANKIDKGFSPINNLKIGAFLFGTFATLDFLKTIEINYIELYIIFIVFAIYTKMSKEYRLLAKEYYRKIKEEYIKKYLNHSIDRNAVKDIDPYGEDTWYPEDAYVNYADEKRYKKKYKFTEDMPFLGLRDKKDVEPE